MENYPKRKRMRLENYDYSAEGYYYLTICTKDRKRILAEIFSDATQDPRVVLTPNGQVVESFLRSIPGMDKYVIMPNHIHMIIHKTNGRSIISDMRAFKSLVTKRIGESIWQESYYDHIIRNEADYQEKWQYIENNPAKWVEDEYFTD